MIGELSGVTMITLDTGPVHDELKNAVAATIKPYSERMDALEILAVLSQMVGMAIGMQDQTKYTVDQLFEVVGANIELGNETLIENLMNVQGVS